MRRRDEGPVTLAYLFWHTPAEGVATDDYESALRDFHDTLSVPSASFRLAVLPFEARAGYEDWYLVEHWRELGELNLAAVAAPRRAHHDAVAHRSAHGWGGVYGLLRGPAHPPHAVRWMAKPAELAYDAFLDSLNAGAVWQRQMVLGPAPEFCLAGDSEALEGRRHPIVYRA
jgi:hypothetical protein